MVGSSGEPVPVRRIVSGAKPDPRLRLSCPSRVPGCEGANWRLKPQLAPTASVEAQVVAKRKSPVMVSASGRGVEPVLVRVTDSVADRPVTVTGVAKATALVETETVAAGSWLMARVDSVWPVSSTLRP